MRVEGFLQGSARRRPDKVALVTGRERLSYGDLDTLSDRLAGALSSRGVERGDRVVLFMENCREAAVGIFAALKAGAVFSPVNASTKPDKLAYLLNHCRATALLTQARLLPAAKAALAQAPSVALTVATGCAGDASEALSFDAALAASAPRPHRPGIDLDLAMLIYTSGSTGRPKGVMMTHQSVVAAAASITSYLENTADDVILSALPISFDYGLYQVLMAAKVGATLVLEKSFAYPRLIFETMAAERVTGFPMVPMMAAIMLQHRDLGRGTFPHLRYITSTAAALPPAHIARLQELFPHVKLYSMYGLAECKRCTFMPPDELRRRPSSVGIPIPNTEAFVIDANGERAAPGVVGELVVRGAHVMKGYWEDPEATSRVLRPGPHPWEKLLYTGDLFRADEDGYLYFVGRRDDIIKSRGEKVSPKEVENVLYALPGVREAAVVGVPDPILGMAIKAILVVAPDAGLEAEDVIRHCKQRLEDFMVPKFLEFRDELPKTESGKISRRRLVAALAEAAP
jgi:amino acid adenylation domain-containing protein